MSVSQFGSIVIEDHFAYKGNKLFLTDLVAGKSKKSHYPTSCLVNPTLLPCSEMTPLRSVLMWWESTWKLGDIFINALISFMKAHILTLLSGGLRFQHMSKSYIHPPHNK